MRKALFLTASLLTLVFTSLWGASFVDPVLIESTAKTLIRQQIEKQVKEKIDAIDEHFLAGKAKQIVNQRTLDIAAVKRALSSHAPERITSVIAEMQNADCECRKKIQASIESSYLWQITHASQTKEQLQTLIRNQYMETAAKLIRDFRVFTGTHALVCLLLVATLFARKQASAHLLPAALVLLAASTVTGYFYLFEQNWLETLIFSNYVGWYYLAYLSLVFALLSDIFFNRGRVTVHLINRLIDAIGSGAASLSPC